MPPTCLGETFHAIDTLTCLFFSSFVCNSFTAANKRVFDVNVEGTLIPNIDIVLQGGGVAFKAITREQPVDVSDGFLTIQFLENVPIVNNAKISGIEVRKAAPHFSHAVTGGPYSKVDTDGNNVEAVPVDASESHTHGPGNVLTSFTWKKGATVLGSGQATSLTLPVGVHTVTLTVVDSSGNQNTDTTTITVQSAAFPSVTSLSPTSGDIAGGTQVTINGSGFGSATSVRFGVVLLNGSAITIVNPSTIRVRSPLSSVGQPVAVSVITPLGESSNAVTFTYVGATPIGFTIANLLDFENPSAVAFGPDGKLYVGNTKGKLGKFTLNDSYDAVVSSVISTINTARGIHGIAFDPLDSADTPNPTVYISSSDIFHGESRNSFGNAINGKIQTVRGNNLDIVADIVTGLPVSELDHAVSSMSSCTRFKKYFTIQSHHTHTSSTLPRLQVNGIYFGQ